MAKSTFIAAEPSSTQSESVPALAPYLQVLKVDFERAFRDSDWENLNRLLASLATVGEREGYRELCLRAQSLQEVLGHRAGGRGSQPGEALQRHYQELSFHLAHLQWRSI